MHNIDGHLGQLTAFGQVRFFHLDSEMWLSGNRVNSELMIVLVSRLMIVVVSWHWLIASLGDLTAIRVNSFIEKKAAEDLIAFLGHGMQTALWNLSYPTYS